MTDHYVDPTASGANDGTSWTDAWQSAASISASAGDRVFQKGLQTITADITITFPNAPTNPVQWIATTDTANEPPLSIADSGAGVDSVTNSVDITVNGSFAMHGITLEVGGTLPASIKINSGNTAAKFWSFTHCTINNLCTFNGGIVLGLASSNSRNRFISKNTTWGLNDDLQYITLTACHWDSFGDSINFTSGTQSLYLIYPLLNSSARFMGLDSSSCTGDIIKGSVTTSNGKIEFVDCKKHTSSDWVDSIASGEGLEVLVSNSSDADINYNLEHHNESGNTTVSVTIYATAGNTYDGTNPYSIKVTGTNATESRPYISPWMAIYNSDTSAITPYLDLIRDGITTAYQDDEVWGEFMTLNNTGFPLTSLTDDRALVSPSNQGSSSLGASDWEGETTPWYGKVQSESVTPAEIGYIYARVGVSGAYTVYVNPGIRGT